MVQIWSLMGAALSFNRKDFVLSQGAVFFWRPYLYRVRTRVFLSKEYRDVPTKNRSM